MAEAYCPYCGVPIPSRGLSHCPHCEENIIDIWKLLNSELPVEAPRRILPPPPPLVWISRLFLAGLLFLLIVMVGYLLFSWLLTVVRAGDSGLRGSLLGAGYMDFFIHHPPTSFVLAVFTGWPVAAARVEYQWPQREPDSGGERGGGYD